MRTWLSHPEVMPMKNIEWWRGTATHMWRVYFAMERDGFEWESLSYPTQRIYAVCNHVVRTRFVKTDQDILQYYFTSRWGDDLYAVEDYSLKHNIPTKVIWMVIRRANRTIMEECGFLEKRGESSDE